VAVTDTVDAPVIEDKSRKESIDELKSKGNRVIKSYDLKGWQKGDKKLSNDSGQWSIQTV